MTTRLPVGVFFALFTISGFAGLIYESIWSHYLKLFLGHAAYAQTLVLAIFMGGMAIGAWLVSRYTHRIRNLLLGYAVAELCIGLLAVSFHKVFLAASAWSFDVVLPALGGTGVDLFKWTLASLIILPASILLGTTFPLMSGGIMRLYPESSGRALSMLYFTNSFGAAAGVLASGFLLIDRFGLPGTILSAGILNILLAFVVWLLSKRVGPVAEVRAAGGEGTSPPDRTFSTALLLAAAVTGAASFIYEITWIRMLSLGLGASTHSFEVMLAAFIFGMSAGAFWLRNRIGRLKDDVAWLAGVLFAKAILAIVAMYVYGGVFDFIRWIVAAVAKTDEGYTLATLAGLLASICVMVPSAFCAGMTLPLATHALTRRGHGEGAIGRIYGANTAGCIVGAAFATHVGMVAFGVKGLTGLGALLDFGTAGALLLLFAPVARRRALAGVVVAILAVGAVGFATVELDVMRLASGVYRYGTFLNPAKTRVLFYEDGKTATVSVLDIDGVISLKTNGKPDASIERDPAKPVTQDEPTMKLLAALPLAIKPSAKDIANIGFGSGITTHTLLGSPRVRRVDTIEIEPGMVEGAKNFKPHNTRAYTDPRSHIHIEDAKTFFAAGGLRYDVIVSEPSNPWVSGVSALFSEEFYGQIRRHLANDGLLVQWLHAYELDLPLLASIFKALGKHFPDYAIYAWGQGDLFVVASPQGPVPPLSAEIFSFPDAKADLAYLGMHGLADLEALRVGGRKALEPLFAAQRIQPNSDFFPILDQRAPRSRFRSDNVFELVEMPRAREALLAMLDQEVRSPRVAGTAKGRTLPPRVWRVRTAVEALDIVVANTGPDLATNVNPGLRNNALVVRSLLPGCEGASSHWLDAVETVASAALPYLEADAIEPYLAKVRQSPCARSLDQDGRGRLLLLDAINRRDAEAMAREAQRLLDRAGPISDDQRSYWLVAAIAGLVKLGRAADGDRLAEKHVGKLVEADANRLLVRLALLHVAGANR